MHMKLTSQISLNVELLMKGKLYLRNAVRRTHKKGDRSGRKKRRKFFYPSDFFFPRFFFNLIACLTMYAESGSVNLINLTLAP